MHDQEAMEHAVAYLLIKKKSISRVNVKEVIYIADIHHLVLYGRPITKSLYQNSYELSTISIRKAMDKRDKLLTLKEHELDMLSQSDKMSLDFALSRYEADFDGLPDKMSVKINY